MVSLIQILLEADMQQDFGAHERQAHDCENVKLHLTWHKNEGIKTFSCSLISRGVTTANLHMEPHILYGTDLMMDASQAWEYHRKTLACDSVEAGFESPLDLSLESLRRIC